MCNLYRMTATVDEMRRVFGSFHGDRSNFPPVDDLYPGRVAPVLRHGDDGGLMLDMMTWGFPGPAAAKGRPVTNVRNLTSPFWRSALDRPERRCIVPVTSFCEWTAEPDPETKRKRKVWFGMRDNDPQVFAFAGIWRPGEERPFMAFLTCEPNDLVGAVHPKAMPVILKPEDVSRWLTDERVSACELAVPHSDDTMMIAEGA